MSVTLVSFLWLSHPASSTTRDDGAPTWELLTSDTRVRVAVVDDRPAIELLSATGSNHHWIDGPVAVPILRKVWLGEREVRLDWKHRDASFREQDGELTLSFASASPSLLLRSIWRARPGHGPVEHRIELSNQSGERVTVAHQDSLSLHSLNPRGVSRICWIKRGGSNASTQGGFFQETISAGHELLLVSNCQDGASPVPWVAIQTEDKNGLYVGWEFSGLGRIHTKASAVGPLHIDLDVGNLPDFKTDVAPGEVLCVPTAFVGCYQGELDDGSYALHRFVIERLRPPVPDGSPDPLLAYNLYLDAGGDRATEKDVLRSARFCRELGFEAFMPDAMWFPETGDWRWDPRRFPTGVEPIEKYVHQSGGKLALWCAWTNGGISSHPEALSVLGPRAKSDWFNADFAADWKPGPFYGAQLCLACDAASEWAEKKTQWLVEHHRLDYLKHDINPIVTQCNKTSHRHRHGVDASFWATLGYYRIQSQLRKKFPHLILENCSGGGHIKDYGVASVTHYTVATDTLSNLPNRQAMFDSTYAFPPLMLQCYTYDNFYPVPGDNPGTYLWRSAMMGAWQIDPTDTAKWTEEERESVRRSVAIYREWIRPILADVQVHHVLPRPDGVHWDGMFYWSRRLRKGTLYVWRPDAPGECRTVRLKGLDADRQYWMWCEDGSIEPALWQGRDLIRDGIELRLPRTFTSDLIFIQDEAIGRPPGLELPAEFRLTSATSDAGVFRASTRFRWEAAVGAKSYRLTIAKDGGFKDVVSVSTVTQPEAQLDELQPGQLLHWRVEAISWGGRRTNSGAVGSFTVAQLVRPRGVAFLSDVPWLAANAGAENRVRRDVNYFGRPITINARPYPKALWTHAYPDTTPADIVYDIAGNKFACLKADAGLDDASQGGSAQFQVLVDGVVKAKSGVLRPREIHRFRVDIRGAHRVTLRVLNGNDGYSCDHAVWGLARLVAEDAEDPVNCDE